MAVCFTFSHPLSSSVPQTREKVADGCWMAGIVSTGLRNLHLEG